ncbi:hypothetical protein M422DRAFT_54864 [Sphaerobolus stellatus SS14]|uniref:Uncharacterized protein n=1 Tax=Sphaerobolus stellatus (strain SS14) TaxID=990650 RepID=A0A0C9UR71_SPHS4|nr:hypothetical protein M422DRAFT_54864 [Sphaerobolus stellatus SS14]
MRNEIKNRGFSWIIPIGKLQTLQEERNDASPDASERSDAVSDTGDNDHDNDNDVDPEPDSAQDLDASMLDMDDLDQDEEEDEGISGDFDATNTTEEQDLSGLIENMSSDQEMQE